ncbi:site-specific DNA-methyltransferase [bacterium]|nr:site-specific DNA-methyltransferase [bacterium]
MTAQAKPRFNILNHTHKQTQIGQIESPNGPIPKLSDEFWTAKQRQLHSLHYAVSYRASFKPELPDFFIRKLTKPGDTVGDPFGGRGTTVLQAVILDRRGMGNDVNPLFERITYPKINPVSIEGVEERMESINLSKDRDLSGEEKMNMFYHPETYKELLNLRDYLKSNRDDIDRFLEMIAISRLHGHSTGFFSAYSFPQISIPKENQIKINKTRGVEPDYREVKTRIIKKARSVLKDGDERRISELGRKSVLTVQDARDLRTWKSNSVNLIVTSPPFLNQVDYFLDNWIEHWFCDIDISKLKERLVQTADLDEWMQFISDSLAEAYRVLVKGGMLAIEVGEVRYQGRILNLDETVVSLTWAKRFNAGQFKVKEVYIQSQEFTKLAHCFNVKNNTLGTNSNRIILMERI